MNNGIIFFLGYVALTVAVGLLLKYPDMVQKKNTQMSLHDVATATGQPVDEFVVETALKFYNAGCVDALEKVKRSAPNSKGDPESYCRHATKAVGKQLAKMRLIK